MGRIFITADLHGSFKPIRDFYIYMNSNYNKSSSLTEEDVIIVLGDFGGNYFFNHRDKEFKEKLKSYKAQFFIVRGNHEQRPSLCAEKYPNLWTKEKMFDNQVWVEKEFPFIKYAIDFPCVYNIHGHKTLIIPGAYSPDKLYRIEHNWSWFEGEQLTEEEMKYGLNLIKENNNKFDIILSHTCPIIFEPTDLFLPTINQNLVDRTTERYLGNIEYNVDYKLFLWGHFHKLRIYPASNEKQCIMLYNDVFLDLDKYFKVDNPINSITNVRAAV